MKWAPYGLQEFLHFLEAIFEVFYITAGTTDVNTSDGGGEKVTHPLGGPRF